ncbi:MAG: hypothetical protein WC613_04490 [Candidatus Aenigmatarchaeota archaeon]
MNKQKILTGLVSISILAAPVLALAQPTGQITNLCTLIQKIESIVWMGFGLIAVIAFVVAGILFLTAGGAAEKIQAARSAFLWGIAGVVVGIVAFSIIAIVGSGLGVGVGGTCA